jgi:hypothetical protein
LVAARLRDGEMEGLGGWISYGRASLSPSCRERLGLFLVEISLPHRTLPLKTRFNYLSGTY